MDYQIRKIHKNECHLLGGFLYEAIYVPEGSPRPPKEGESNSISNQEDICQGYFHPKNAMFPFP